MGFSRQEDQSGLPFPSPGDLWNLTICNVNYGLYLKVCQYWFLNCNEYSTLMEWCWLFLQGHLLHDSQPLCFKINFSLCWPCFSMMTARHNFWRNKKKKKKWNGNRIIYISHSCNLVLRLQIIFIAFFLYILISSMSFLSWNNLDLHYKGMRPWWPHSFQTMLTYNFYPA